MSPTSWAARGPPPTSGWRAIAARARPAWWTARAGPHRCPHRTPAALEARILEARRLHRRGADWLGAELGLAASTVGRVLARHGLPRLRDLDALTGEPVRRGPVSRLRYERARPGELVHMDVKKLGRIPEGGGWRPTDAAPSPTGGGGSATTMSTRPSTTTPGWPTRRSTPTSAGHLRRVPARAAAFFASPASPASSG